MTDKYWQLIVLAAIVSAYCLAAVEDHRRPASDLRVYYAQGENK